MVPVFLTGVAWYHEVRPHDPSLTANFQVQWSDPSGWLAYHGSPSTLFLYRHASSGAMLRGSQIQVVADVNPSPELDTDGLAGMLVDNIGKQSGWSATVDSDLVSHQGQRYRIVRREGPDKIAMTAVTAKGNTTLMVALVLDREKEEHLPLVGASFRQFLREIRLKPYRADQVR
jgi:hypothetical protein